MNSNDTPPCAYHIRRKQHDHCSSRVASNQLSPGLRRQRSIHVCRQESNANLGAEVLGADAPIRDAHVVVERWNLLVGWRVVLVLRWQLEQQLVREFYAEPDDERVRRECCGSFEVDRCGYRVERSRISQPYHAQTRSAVQMPVLRAAPHSLVRSWLDEMVQEGDFGLDRAGLMLAEERG